MSAQDTFQDQYNKCAMLVYYSRPIIANHPTRQAYVLCICICAIHVNIPFARLKLHSYTRHVVVIDIANYLHEYVILLSAQAIIYTV